MKKKKKTGKGNNNKSENQVYNKSIIFQPSLFGINPNLDISNS